MERSYGVATTELIRALDDQPETLDTAMDRFRGYLLSLSKGELALVQIATTYAGNCVHEALKQKRREEAD